VKIGDVDLRQTPRNLRLGRSDAIIFTPQRIGPARRSAISRPPHRQPVDAIEVEIAYLARTDR